MGLKWAVGRAGTALVFVGTAVLVGTPTSSGAHPPGVTERVSISTAGAEGNDMSGRFAGPAISADGLVVAFDSIAQTLVPNDGNNEADVFVHDRTTGVTERVSVSSAGVEGDNDSTRPGLDGSGNLVVFDSSSTNLVAADTNSSLDVFVHDRSTGTTTRVSVSSGGAQGNLGGHSPVITPDGKFVAFVSNSSNLVANDTNNSEDIFVRDLQLGTTELVTLNNAGEQLNSSSTSVAISADGGTVAFTTFASNTGFPDSNFFVDVFVRDLDTGLFEPVSVNSDEVFGDFTSAGPSLSADGQLVAFWSDSTNLVPGDTNDRRDIFLRDRAGGTTERISVNSDEEQADGTSQEPGVRGFTASGPDITPDGRFVAFFASATNLVPGDTNTCPQFFSEPGTCPDVFVRDRVAGTTERRNVASDGTQAIDRSSDVVISDDGLVVAFWSAAWNLIVGDTNTCPLFTQAPGNCPDIFVHDDREEGGGDGADLEVTTTDSPDPVIVGDSLRYTFTITNLGPETATGVSLSNPLPRRVEFRGVKTSAGTCLVGARTVQCALGTITPGASVTVRVAVVPTRSGTLENTVSVAGLETDPVPANNDDVETTKVRAAG